MNIRNCKRCGRIFNYVTGPQYCPSCRKIIEEQFQTVKSFIYDNHHASIIEISETCEVPIKQIHEWVREERLVFPEDSAIGIECERCGKTIKTGRFCEDCKNDLQHGFVDKKEAKPIKKSRRDETKARMRFFNQNKG